MSDIISKWLTETLGIIVEVYSETFIRLIRNGYLIGALLRHYNIISTEHLTSLTAAGDSADCLDRIGIWLKEVDVELDDEVKRQLARGKISTALDLLYRLYLVFQNKDPLHYSAKQLQTEKARNENDRFWITPVEDETIDIEADAPHDLSNALDNYKHIVHWHAERHSQLLKRCEEQRRSYEKYMAKRTKDYSITYSSVAEGQKTTSDGIPVDDVQSLNENYEELLSQEVRAKELPPFAPNPNITKEMVKRLKIKYGRERANVSFQAKMEAIVLAHFWDDLVTTQSNKIESHISEKLLKQSYYEKQITGKMFEIREQKEIMAENRVKVLKEIQKKRDFELVEYIIAKEKESGNERYRYYFERDRALDLHKKLYQEKERLKMQRKLEICKNILEDIVDIALRCAQYTEMYEEEMPDLVRSDMATLFVSSQPIFDLVPNEEVIIEYEPSDDMEEELYLAEIDRHNAMDIRNLEKYCRLESPWKVEVHAPEYIEGNLLAEIDIAQNILGHIVFRLLLAKYPKPAPKPPPNVPKVHMAVCINGITDLTILPILKKLLSERQVLVLQMEDAINFCLQAYKDEITAEYPESQFVDETQEALALVAAKKKGKIDTKKDRKKKGEKNYIKKKSILLEEYESFIALPFQDKQIQTPRILPCDEPVLTSAAELGRLAYEILNLGEALNDKLLVQMFVEYLKTLKNIDGWCLINYPTNLEQMSLLEEALTSKSVVLITKDETHEDKAISDLNNIVSLDHAISDDGSADLRALFCAKMFMEDRCSKELKVEESMQNLPELNEGDNIEDIADLDYREVKQNSVTEDANARFRVSRLLTNPDPPAVKEDYDCYLTAFIRMVQEIPNEADLQETLNEAKLDDVDQFYQAQGCLYNLYYKVLDLATIKHIGKLIIGDYTVPPKTSVQIFGDTVLYLENDLGQGEPIPGKTAKSQSGGEKEEKPPKPIKKEKPDPVIEDKKSKKGKKGKDKKETASDKNGKKEKKKKKGMKGEGDAAPEPDVVILKMDKETQMPEPPPEIEDIESVPEPEPMPGEANWKYVDLPLPEAFQVVLATLWENLEEIFVCDLRELFFRWRILWKNVMPYLTYVRHYMTDFIQRPDDKQVHLYAFQRVYNSIDEDMRNDDEVKAELHCRVNEFREKMLQICDTRMRESEEERKKMVMQDWIMKQACELIDINIIAMQLEVDRCCDTFQLLNDYYVAMITKMPCAEDVLEKQSLNYLSLKENFEFENFEVYSDFMRVVLTNIEETCDNSVYHKFLADNYAKTGEIVSGYRDKSLNILSGMENYFQPKGKKSKPKKDPKAKGKGKLKLPKFSGPDQEVKEVGLKLVDEWRCAINGEYTRVCLRLQLIKALGDIDLQAMLSSSMKTFHGLYNEIKERYNREVYSVKECCDLLCRAVEEEVSIQPELVLTGDEFYINPEIRLYEDALPEPELVLKETEKPEKFTIAQLSYISDILFDLAPSGVIPERAFVFLLQDLIVNNAEDGAPPLVPQLWQQLQPQNMNKLSYHFFGQVEMIDWKDFIIYNLGVEFPNENELMQTRRQFREFDVDSNEYVYDYQFMTVRFWFEHQFDLTDPHEVFRLQEMKKLLFKLYSIDKERVNYTALLLAFCRDRDPNMGLAKALQLSLGKFVCWDVETGEAFTEVLRQRQLEQLQDKLRIEMEAAEKVETVGEVIDTLIDLTVHKCESSYLESYCSAETTENNVTQDDVVDLELLYLDHLMDLYDDGLQNEEHSPQYFLHEECANSDIYFDPKYYPCKVYYLVFDVLLAVMMAAMPWMAITKNNGEPSFRQVLEDLYESCRNKEFEKMVLMHEFLNSKKLKELLHCSTKFVIKNPRVIINELLEDR